MHPGIAPPIVVVGVCPLENVAIGTSVPLCRAVQNVVASSVMVTVTGSRVVVDVFATSGLDFASAHVAVGMSVLFATGPGVLTYGGCRRGMVIGLSELGRVTWYSWGVASASMAIEATRRMASMFA